MSAKIIEFPVDPVWLSRLKSEESIASLEINREMLHNMRLGGRPPEEVLEVMNEWKRIRDADPRYWHRSFRTYDDVLANLKKPASNVEPISDEPVTAFLIDCDKRIAEIDAERAAIRAKRAPK